MSSPKKRKLISDFFKKSSVADFEAGDLRNDDPMNDEGREFLSDTPGPSGRVVPDQPNVGNPVQNPVQLKNDIGIVFKNGQRDTTLLLKLTDLDKKELLSNHWMPEDNFKYPALQKGVKNPQKVYLGKQHISGSNGCFKYSPSLLGLVCIPCVLFASNTSENDRRKATTFGQLVNKPLSKYGHLTGSDGHLTAHLSKEYHKASQAFADAFLHSIETHSDIMMMVNDQHKQLVKENRERLIPIVKTTILCGRLGIAYRRKSKPKSQPDPDSDHLPLVEKDGNFNALLEFRVDAGDTILEKHLKSTGKNATYISKTIQNDLINICGDIVAESIVDDVRRVKYFSVLADETTDSSHKEQLCICLRYVKMQKDGQMIREEFLQFQNASDLTGAGLARQILVAIRGHGLDPLYLVGQGYDGASAMSGYANGVQANVRKEAPNAVYVHCGSHSLNLVLNSSSSVPEIRSMFTIVQESTKFINDSVKRREVMAQNLRQAGSTLTQLKSLCETRFVERHDALLIFQQNYATIVDAFEELTSSADRKTADKARSLLRSLTEPVFLVSLCCAKKVMVLTHSLSRALQTVNKDLIHAMEGVDFVKRTLESWRVGEGDDQDYSPHTAAQNLAQSVDVTLTIPRLAGRFTAHSALINKMAVLVPSQIGDYTWNDVKASILLYKEVLGDPDEEEIHLQFLEWKDFCSGLEMKPSTPLDALDMVPGRMGHIRNLLVIFCTVPVTTCSAERAFSALRILKNYLRNRMTDDRLTGLALMYIHPEIPIDVHEVINRFAFKKHRKLDFVL